VDWHEVWSKAYWRDYLGGLGGLVGWLVQKACVRVRQRAFTFSQLQARRLREEGARAAPVVLEGEYAGPLEPAPPRPASDSVVFAGRHIPEKRVPALVDAFVEVHRARPELRLDLYGDGPDFAEVGRRIAACGLSGVAVQRGFVDGPEVEAALASARCLVLPSAREGYGLVVVEASQAGTPSVVVRGEDNAATELVDAGENGWIAASVEPGELARAILAAVDGGEALRESTRAWFSRNAERLSLDGSLRRVAESYRR
jgi:glycosyltransferase involved in cell wall biosynthesis